MSFLILFSSFFFVVGGDEKEMDKQSDIMTEMSGFISDILLQAGVELPADRIDARKVDIYQIEDRER